MDSRRHPRFPVRFHSSFHSVNIVSGNGLLQDISLFGCKILSSAPVRPGTSLDLRMEMGDDGPSIHVRQAVVRWIANGVCGLEFLDLSEPDWSRLQQLIKELEKQPYERPCENAARPHG
jgi:c-di-GMP-binding flagellar brake protein YcgR